MNHTITNLKINDWVMYEGFPIMGLKTPKYGIVVNIKERREDLLSPLITYQPKLYFDFSDIPFGEDYLDYACADAFVKVDINLLKKLRQQHFNGLKKLIEMVRDDKRIPWTC